MTRHLIAWTTALLAACSDRGAAAPSPCLRSDVNLALSNNRIDALDVLFVLDDSAAVGPRAASLSRALGAAAEAIVRPAPHETYGSVQLAVVSADLGARGVDGCTEDGDDGRLNLRACTSERLPPFVLFTSEDDPPRPITDFTCAVDLRTAGCPVQQPLEAAYRALVAHDTRARRGNTSPNAGFVRYEALLALVVVSPGDASVRDCRRAEPGVACEDATDVFDPASARWAGASLDERLTRYADGSPQDPTWSLDRYLDPRRPERGFTGLKPGRPENVVFMVATAVPLDLTLDSTQRSDWDALLPAELPAGSRRLVAAARRFATSYANGAVVSIERDDLTPLTRPMLQRIQAGRFVVGCLPRTLIQRAESSCCDATGAPWGCAASPTCETRGATTVRCGVTETLSPATDANTWCTAEHGRRRGPDRSGRATCRVDQVAVLPGTAPPCGAHGYFYDTRVDAANPGCTQRITFTAGDGLRYGSEGNITCAGDVPEGC